MRITLQEQASCGASEGAGTFNGTFTIEPFLDIEAFLDVEDGAFVGLVLGVGGLHAVV